MRSYARIRKRRRRDGSVIALLDGANGPGADGVATSGSDQERPTAHESIDLLTVPEVAELLRISRNLAYELVAQHQLPAVRFGRVIRVPRNALAEWVQQKSSQSPPGLGIPNTVPCRR